MRGIADFSGAADAFRLRGPLADDPTARVFNAMLWTLTAWFGIWGLLLLPLHWRDHLWSMQNQIVTTGALICALLLLRKGRLQGASLAYLGGIWFFATHVMALNGGIRSNAQELYVTLPICAAWLLGYRAALWTAGICMSCTLVFAILELSGHPLPRRIPGTPLGAWAVFGMACLIGSVPVAQILRTLTSALARSRRAEDASRVAMERLRTEVQEHKRTVQALSESEERFRVTADTAPVMILARTADQKGTFFNKVWLDFTGRKLEDELGRGWMEDVHPEDLSGYLDALSAAYKEHKKYRLQFRLRRADGEYRLILCHGVPYSKSGRPFEEYIASCIDITDLKRSQEEALSRQKLESLGLLAAGIAHDFNNLLGSISAQSELLMEELESPAARESVVRMQSIIARAAEIVRELMIYAGRESAALEEVDLAVLAQEMIPLMKVSIAKNTRFEVNLPAGLPMIQANAAQLRQVFLNLVTNASEALGGKEGTIAVMLSEIRSQESNDGSNPPRGGGHYLRLDVSDTGCGMTDQLKAKIFDPFFTTKGAGRGLGLAAVRGIVLGHGGNISVASSPGGGSRFQILLPCPIESEQAPRGTESTGSGSDTASPAKTILVIEDEETLRRAVAALLHTKGFHVLEAGDGSTAVEVLRAHASQIDVAVLDATLPGLSSGEVLKRIQDIRAEINVIITSAYGRDQALGIANAEPSRPYIRKPYRIQELLSVIRDNCTDQA